MDRFASMHDEDIDKLGISKQVLYCCCCCVVIKSVASCS